MFSLIGEVPGFSCFRRLAHMQCLPKFICFTSCLNPIRDLVIRIREAVLNFLWPTRGCGQGSSAESTSQRLGLEGRVSFQPSSHQRLKPEIRKKWRAEVLAVATQEPQDRVEHADPVIRAILEEHLTHEFSPQEFAQLVNGDEIRGFKISVQKSDALQLAMGALQGCVRAGAHYDSVGGYMGIGTEEIYHKLARHQRDALCSPFYGWFSSYNKNALVITWSGQRMGESHQFKSFPDIKGLVHINCPIEDSANGLEQLIGICDEGVFAAKTKAINGGHPVFEHCSAGQSRSAAACILYLVETLGVTFDQAHRYLKSCRRQIEDAKMVATDTPNPRPNLMYALKAYCDAHYASA
jgi:hypothetical protein